jgi:hypothetical protein
MAIKIDRCKQTDFNGWSQQKNIVFIGWKQLQKGWIKLYSDCAYKSSINLSGCGGLL